MEKYQNSDKVAVLAKTLEACQANLPGKIQIGVELEFYLLQKKLQPVQWTPEQEEHFFQQLQERLQQATLPLYGLEEEDGEGQFEVKLSPTIELNQLPTYIRQTRTLIQRTAKNFHLIADFTTTPLPHDCSSSLQFNISLCNQKGENLFADRNPSQNPLLQKVVAGLLLLLPESMVFFAPRAEDYQRFEINNNRRLYSLGKQVAPINISWGPNNRTAAIRIPSITANIDLNNNQRTSWVKQLEEHIDLKLCRIEHRVPAGNCDLELSLVAIILGITSGIQQICPIIPPLNGDAYDMVNHHFAGFANTFAQAEHDFLQGEKLRPWLDNLTAK